MGKLVVHTMEAEQRKIHLPIIRQKTQRNKYRNYTEPCLQSEDGDSFLLSGLALMSINFIINTGNELI
jgi:hypothetical protein